METKDAIDKIIQKLVFEVEALPQENLVSFTSKGQIKPVNVKIRLRKKSDHERFYNGFISIPKLGQSTSKPEKIRLAKSDQTIISFNLLMEGDKQTTIEKKPLKKIFNLFKAGGCLTRNDDDDEYAYLPRPSIYNVQEQTNKNQSTSLYKTNHTKSKTSKKFFGQCKPGGCLDPPFGEEEYSYFPAINKHSVCLDNKVKLNLKQKINKYKLISDGDESIVSSEKDDVTTNNKKVLRSSINEEKIDSKCVVSIYKKTSMETSLETSYSNSIITYPSFPSASNVRSNNETISFNETNDTKSIVSKTNKLSNEIQKNFYMPPKKKIHTTEKNDLLDKPNSMIHIYDAKVKISRDKKKTLTDTILIKKSTSSHLDIHNLSPNILKGSTSGLKKPETLYNDIANSKIKEKLQPWLSIKGIQDVNSDRARNSLSYNAAKLNKADLISSLTDNPPITALGPKTNMTKNTQHESNNEDHVKMPNIHINKEIKNKEDLSNKENANHIEKSKISTTILNSSNAATPEVIEIIRISSFKSHENVLSDENILSGVNSQIEIINQNLGQKENLKQQHKEISLNYLQSDIRIDKEKSASLLNENNKLLLNKMVTSSKQQDIYITKKEDDKALATNSTLKIINNDSKINRENTYENKYIDESVLLYQKLLEKSDSIVSIVSKELLIKSTVTKQESFTSLIQKLSKQLYHPIAKAVEVKNNITYEGKLSNEICDKEIVRELSPEECLSKDKLIDYYSINENIYKQNNFIAVINNSSSEKQFKSKNISKETLKNNEGETKFSIKSFVQRHEPNIFVETLIDPFIDEENEGKKEQLAKEKNFSNCSQHHENQSIYDDNIIDPKDPVSFKGENEPYDQEELFIISKHVSSSPLQKETKQTTDELNCLILQLKESIVFNSDAVKNIDKDTKRSSQPYFSISEFEAITPISNGIQKNIRISCLASPYDKIPSYKELEEPDRKKEQLGTENMSQTFFDPKNKSSLSLQKKIEHSQLDSNSPILQQKETIMFDSDAVKNIVKDTKRSSQPYFSTSIFETIPPISNEIQKNIRKLCLALPYDKIASDKKLEEPDRKIEHMPQIFFDSKNKSSLSLQEKIEYSQQDSNTVILQQKSYVDFTLDVNKNISGRSKNSIINYDNDVDNNDNDRPPSPQKSNKSSIANLNNKNDFNIFDSTNANAVHKEIKSDSNIIATTEYEDNSFWNPTELVSRVDYLVKNAIYEKLAVPDNPLDHSFNLKNQLMDNNNNDYINEKNVVSNTKITLEIPPEDSENSRSIKENKNIRLLENSPYVQNCPIELDGSHNKSQKTSQGIDRLTNCYANSFSFTNIKSMLTKNKDLKEPNKAVNYNYFNLLEDGNINNKATLVKDKIYQKYSVDVKDAAKITNLPGTSIKQNKSDKTALDRTRESLTPFINSTSQKHLQRIFQVDLGFQSYCHSNKKLVIKSFDTSKEPDRRPTDTLSTLKTTTLLKSNNNFVVGLDEQHDMFINIMQKLDPPNLDIEGQEANSRIGLKKNQIKPINTKEENSRLMNSLNMVYELQLLPLKEIIKSIKLEVDDITEKKDILRNKLLTVEKAKPLKLISGNKKCGCLCNNCRSNKQ